MNRKWWLIIILTIGGACAGRATLIAYWDFNTSTSVSGGTESRTATLDLSGADGHAYLSTGGGTSVNHVGTDAYGNALIIAAGSQAGEDGQYITFSLSMSGYQNLILTYATVRTSTGFTSQQWSYSFDGTSFTSFSSISGSAIPTASGTIASSSYGLERVDFSSLSRINDKSSVWIRLTLNGAGVSGSDHFDNIQFNADTFSSVPEPAAWGAASGTMLLAFCAFQLWQQRRFRNHPAAG